MTARLLVGSAVLLAPAGMSLGQCRQSEMQPLFPGQPQAFSELGRSVAIGDGVLLVGAPFHEEAGAVFVFSDVNGTWVEVQILRPADARPGDRFGFSVAIDGDIALVGAPLAGGSGAAWVFRFDGSRWSEEQRIAAAGGSTGDLFARRVALDAGVAVIGAPLDDEGGRDAGAVFVLRFDGSRWVEEVKLIAGDAEASDFFGYSVAIDSDVIVTGAIFDDDLREAAGAVYVWRFSDGAWIPEQKLVADSILECCGRVGTSVAISGEVIVAGSFQLTFSDFGATGGTAYVFRFDGARWVEEQQLNSRERDPDDDFSVDVAVDGDVALVGVSLDDDAGPASGAAFAYRFDASIGLWREERKLVAGDAASGDRLGFAVDLNGGRAVVGAPEAHRPLIDSGAAYVFDEVDRPGPEAGTVNSAAGLPTDVLRVNGSAGGVYRDVLVSANDVLTLTLDAAPFGPDPARYVVWVWRAPPSGPFGIPAFSTNCQALRVGGESLGFTVNPTPAHPGRLPQPILCLRSQGIGRRACGSGREAPGPVMAPWTLVKNPATQRFELLVTIQALIEDRGAANTIGFSVSNAVALTVR